MYTALVAIQLILAIGIIALVLLQHGKGADAGAAFGSGASGTVFGSRGSANFLSRSTGALATLFFITSLALAVMISRGQVGQGSLVDKVELPTAPVVEAQGAPEIEEAPAAAPAPQGAPE